MDKFDKLIDKHFCVIMSHKAASVQHYLETGNISGTFRMSLRHMLADACGGNTSEREQANEISPLVSGSALIADFMGVKEKKSTFESYGKPSPYWYSSYLGYRTPAFSSPNKSLEHLLNKNKFLHSWDWLMPVYRKIRDIINERAKLDKHTRTKGDLLELDAQMAICAVDIQKAFDSIVAFIKWHNASLADR